MSKFVWAQADDIKCHIHTTPGCHMCHKIVTEMSQDCTRDVADVSPDVTRDVTAKSHICHTLSQAVATTVTLVTPCHRVSIHLSTCRQVDIYRLGPAVKSQPCETVVVHGNSGTKHAASAAATSDDARLVGIDSCFCVGRRSLVYALRPRDDIVAATSRLVLLEATWHWVARHTCPVSWQSGK